MFIPRDNVTPSLNQISFFLKKYKYTVFKAQRKEFTMRAGKMKASYIYILASIVSGKFI